MVPMKDIFVNTLKHFARGNSHNNVESFPTIKILKERFGLLSGSSSAGKSIRDSGVGGNV